MAGKKKKFKPVVISIDNREKDAEFIGYLKRFGALLDEGFFEIGDLGIIGDVNYAFEHKSVNDLANSLKSGRLFRQIRDLVVNSEQEGQEYQPVLLLVGDVWRLWKQRGYNDWQIGALLNSIQFGWGVPIMYAHNNRFAAIRLITLARRYQHKRDKKKIHPMRFGKKKEMSSQEEALYIVEGFPDISGVRARKILFHYGSLASTIEAMQSGNIAEVKGIGPKIAERVKKVFEYVEKEV